MSSQQELKKLSKRKPRISVRKLDKKTVLIEGNSTGLKFLGILLISLSEADDCGEQRLLDSEEVSYFLRTQNSDFISIG